MSMRAPRQRNSESGDWPIVRKYWCVLNAYAAATTPSTRANTMRVRIAGGAGHVGVVSLKAVNLLLGWRNLIRWRAIPNEHMIVHSVRAG